MKWEARGETLVADAGEYTFWLQPRPTYCDRGRYVAMVSYQGPIHVDEIDGADAWPRYYFDLGVAKSEIEAWLANRLRQRAARGAPPSAVVVHVLFEGVTLCAHYAPSLVSPHDPPSEWPANHRWVGLRDVKQATCAICLAHVPTHRVARSEESAR